MSPQKTYNVPSAHELKSVRNDIHALKSEFSTLSGLVDISLNSDTQEKKSLETIREIAVEIHVFIFENLKPIVRLDKDEVTDELVARNIDALTRIVLYVHAKLEEIQKISLMDLSITNTIKNIQASIDRLISGIHISPEGTDKYVEIDGIKAHIISKALLAKSQNRKMYVYDSVPKKRKSTSFPHGTLKAIDASIENAIVFAQGRVDVCLTIKSKKQSSDNEYLLITIKNDGETMTKAQIEQFGKEALTTTRDQGNGIGTGIIASVMQEIGGIATAFRRKYGGTRIVLQVLIQEEH